jgi:hypothetical protein
MMTYSNPSLRNVILDNALVLGSYDLILTNALKHACKDDKKHLEKTIDSCNAGDLARLQYICVLYLGLNHFPMGLESGSSLIQFSQLLFLLLSRFLQCRQNAPPKTVFFNPENVTKLCIRSVLKVKPVCENNQTKMPVTTVNRDMTYGGFLVRCYSSFVRRCSMSLQWMHALECTFTSAFPTHASTAGAYGMSMCVRVCLCACACPRGRTFMHVYRPYTYAKLRIMTFRKSF